MNEMLEIERTYYDEITENLKKLNIDDEINHLIKNGLWQDVSQPGFGKVAPLARYLKKSKGLLLVVMSVLEQLGVEYFSESDPPSKKQTPTY